MKRFAAAIGAIALLLMLMASATIPTHAQGASSEDPDFSHPLAIDNPYFPLRPGTIYIYRGTEDGEPAYEVFTVTERTKWIQGIRTRVIRDRNWVNGELIEETFDWFAQDDDGNVWYFGEYSTDYENGQVVGHEGSWQAGVNGASAGIVMEARPRVGDTYEQENAPGIAEDMATVLRRNAHACVPFGCFSHVLITKDFTPLEPGIVEQKYYARGIGLIKSVLVKGGSEVYRLVRIVRE